MLSCRPSPSESQESQSWYEYWFPWLFPTSSTSEVTPSEVPVPTQSDTPSVTREVRYAGRPVSASPATGNKKTHQRELKNLLEESLTVSQ